MRVEAAQRGHPARYRGRLAAGFALTLEPGDDVVGSRGDQCHPAMVEQVEKITDVPPVGVEGVPRSVALRAEHGEEVVECAGRLHAPMLADWRAGGPFRPPSLSDRYRLPRLRALSRPC